MSVVPFSAAYGTGGRLVGAEVARRLEVKLADEGITVAIAGHFLRPVGEVAAHEEHQPRFWDYFAYLSGLCGTVGYPGGPFDDDVGYRSCADQMIRGYATGGAVILGRGGAIVLADFPGALHVRLDGPVRARIAQAVELGGVDERTARRHQRQTDQVRERYVRHYYHADITDRRHFDLVLDATSLPLATCVEVIVAAARHLDELERIGVCLRRLRRSA